MSWSCVSAQWTDRQEIHFQLLDSNHTNARVYVCLEGWLRISLGRSKHAYTYRSIT
jgi:hypothetical protein